MQMEDYVVKKNDSLMKLSYLCGHSEKMILKINNLPSNVLVPGMVLIIPKITDPKK